MYKIMDSPFKIIVGDDVRTLPFSPDSLIHIRSLFAFA